MGDLRGAKATGAEVPYADLYIYYLAGGLREENAGFGKTFIGNWQEDGFTFLFFAEPALDQIDGLLAAHPELTLLDQYQMPYAQWHGDAVSPFRAGGFSIAPPWAYSGNGEPVSSESHLLIDPGVVFGTGSHPTTRHCLEALEEAFRGGPPESVLDLGTGTGLLAIAAARLGAAKVLAADLNLLAARTARDNVRLNHLEHHILVVQGRAEELIRRPAELVVANIHYAVMDRLIDSGSFADKKSFVLSGLLRSEARAIRGALDRPPFQVLRVWDHENTWYTFYGRIRGDAPD